VSSGNNGLVRGKGVRTTVPDRNAARAADLLDRDFTAAAPNRRWVADFTYVRTWAGFAYVSSVIHCYSRAIVGWHASMTRTTPLTVRDVLRHDSRNASAGSDDVLTCPPCVSAQLIRRQRDPSA
jgi:transposase InsO family protein